MTSPPFDLGAYLERIGLSPSSPPPATPAGLAAVHRAQMRAIPFENLDVVLGRGVSLEAASIFEKLVHRRRGGYCFECNLLLRDGLRALGFPARLIMGRVMLGSPASTPPRTHVAVLVADEGHDAGGRGSAAFIADAGFGGPTPRTPITLGGGPAPDRPDDPGTRDAWRVIPDDAFGFRVQRVAPGGSASDLYVFDLGTVHALDLELANHWTSTHPSSHFVQRPIAARHTDAGRHTLIADRVFQRTPEASTSHRIADAEALARDLHDVFGIHLDATPAEFDHLLARGRAMTVDATDPRA